MTASLITGILLSFLAPLGLWVAISRSPLIPDLVELLKTQEPMTHEDVENWLIGRGQMKLFRLWTCPHCQAFWTSTMQGAATTLFLCIVHSPLCAFLWPILIMSLYPITLYTILKLWKS